MLTSFFRLHARHLLAAAMLLLPWLAVQSNSLPANNDLETWLPLESEVRSAYRGFTKQFGGEELILVGLVNRGPDDPLVESVASRLERLPGIRKCWTPKRLARVMEDLGVPAEEVEGRLRGLTNGKDGRLTGVIALLSEQGLADRAGTVSRVRAELNYCQVGEDQLLLSGPPVVVAELDRLGGTEANKRFFLSIFLISGLLLYGLLRDARLAIGIVAVTFWAVLATNTVIKLLGGEMNFILSALPVMVLIFTLSTAVHYLHYIRSCQHHRDPVGEALRKALGPCFWAMLTTVIGLLSLMVSDIAPVRQFGWAASIGAVVSLLAALLFTPALVQLWPQSLHRERKAPAWVARLGHGILHYRRRIVVVTLVLVFVTGTGLPLLHSKINPVEFLPTGSSIVSDLIRVEEELTPAESIEAVVDFGIRDLPFLEKLHLVREIEREIARQPGVKHTVSLASFFPTVMPESALETMRILGRASSQAGQNDFVSAGERFWRISARVSGTPDEKYQIYRRLQQLSDRYPVTFTGLAPLLVHAQRIIFNGFWESFATAFLIITGVMMISLRSVKLALVAMIPNVTPISIVFGLLGWWGLPVDIGMMMTASIALGIAVDGTFHFVMAYRRSLRHDRHVVRASRRALFLTGAPILQAALIAGTGMLALACSQFTPTVRFGVLMATLLLVAVLGDLVLLPSLLALGPCRRRSRSASESSPCTAARPLAEPSLPEATAA
jgi:predicted RND superfamily exporter protein